MFRASTHSRRVAIGVAAAVILIVPMRASAREVDVPRAAAAPSVREFMRVLDAQIQRAKPREVFRRTIIFADVAAGEAEGNVYPFTTAVTIHDFNPGNTTSHYSGRTCITRISSTRYNMLRDRLGEWTVEMRPAPEPLCAGNPADGKSAFPLDSLHGTRVGTSLPPPEVMTKKRVNVNLRLGEYACTWPGGRLASQMRFRLNRDRTYTDVEGARGGTYTFDPLAGTLMFHAGFLDKMGGKSVDDTSVFMISASLTCAPW